MGNSCCFGCFWGLSRPGRKAWGVGGDPTAQGPPWLPHAGPSATPSPCPPRSRRGGWGGRPTGGGHPQPPRQPPSHCPPTPAHRRGAARRGAAVAWRDIVWRGVTLSSTAWSVMMWRRGLTRQPGPRSRPLTCSPHSRMGVEWRKCKTRRLG